MTRAKDISKILTDADISGTLDVTGNLTVTGDLASSTSGTSNFRAGVNAGNSITSGGNYNVVVGDEALTTDTKGSKSVAVGKSSLGSQNFTSATDTHNVAVGYNAGGAVSVGQFNTLIGSEAGDALTSGGFNVALGTRALSSENGHGSNVAIGYEALRDLDAGADGSNVAVGQIAGRLLSTGIENTLIGANAGDSLTDADYNVAVGKGTLSTDTKGSRSTAIGYNALSTQNLTSSSNSNNTAIGYNAGSSITAGTLNTIVGASAGDALQNSGLNTLIGQDAGTAMDSGKNTCVGQQSGSLITSGGDNTILGRYNGNQYGLDIRTLSNRIVLSDGDGNPRFYINNTGYTNASPDISDSTRTMSGVTSHVLHQDLGDITAFIENSNSNPYGAYFHFSGGAPNNNSNYFLFCADTSATRLVIKSDGDVQNTNNSYSALSDQKLKEQITDASSQWNDIKALTVRKYKMKEDVAKGDSDAHWRLGVVAQELETAGMNGLVKDNPELVKNEEGDLVAGDTTTKSVKYSILYMKAVKALQEAMERIETLEEDVKTLKGE